MEDVPLPITKTSVLLTEKIESAFERSLTAEEDTLSLTLSDPYDDEKKNRCSADYKRYHANYLMYLLSDIYQSFTLFRLNDVISVIDNPTILTGLQMEFVEFFE